MRKAAIRAAAGVSALTLTVTLTACGDGDRTPDTTPTVVASTDVWGSVAQAVAGDHAKVTSIINSASADPHSFKASPSDTAAIAGAALVVYNGGGYDHWVDDALSSHPGVASVDAFALLQPPPGEPQPANANVFYDLNTAKAVAAKVADLLTRDDPQHGADYQANAESFNRGVDAIAQTERAIRTTNPGAAVAATDPVAHYLLDACGLTDKTPPGFTSAVDQDTDPAPGDVTALLDLIKDHRVATVLVDEQTITEVTKQVQAAAQSAGIPIVEVTETLPAGSDYLTWQRDIANRLTAALAQR